MEYKLSMDYSFLFFAFLFFKQLFENCLESILVGYKNAVGGMSPGLVSGPLLCKAVASFVLLAPGRLAAPSGFELRNPQMLYIHLINERTHEGLSFAKNSGFLPLLSSPYKGYFPNQKLTRLHVYKTN